MAKRTESSVIGLLEMNIKENQEINHGMSPKLNQLVEQHHHLRSPNRIGAGDRGDYIDADAGFFTSATWHVVADLFFGCETGGEKEKQSRANEPKPGATGPYKKR